MTSRSTKDLIHRIRNSKNQDMKESYGTIEEYENVPTIDNSSPHKLAYPQTVNSKASMRGSTSHLRNLSSYNKQGDGLELPMIKSSNKDTLAQIDLEQKLK